MYGKPKCFRVAPDPSERLFSSGTVIQSNKAKIDFKSNLEQTSKIDDKTNFKNVELTENVNNVQILTKNNENKDFTSMNKINLEERFNEKLQNYLKVRQRIFNDTGLTKRVLNARRRCRDRRDLRKAIEATQLDRDSDIRPYLDVTIFGRKITGLADTGSEVIALGKNAEEFLKDVNVKMVPFNGLVSTADNSKSKIVGKVKACIPFKCVEKMFTILIVPSLKQPLYLGANFIKAYNLAPNLFAFEEISDTTSVNPDMHVLTTTQNDLLQKVVAKFPSFDNMGLGRTHLLNHSIDTGNSPPIKQRHYPYSPAVQKVLEEAVDNMLKEGIIQHSESGWNSPIAPVIKRSVWTPES